MSIIHPARVTRKKHMWYILPLVILAALFITSTIAQFLETLHGPHGARNPARLTHAVPQSIAPLNPDNTWVHGNTNPGDPWLAEYHQLDNNNKYKDKAIVFEYIKPKIALQNYLQHHKVLPLHYGVIDWNEIRLYNEESHAKGKFEVSSKKVENRQKNYNKTIKKLETSLRNNCDTFLWRSKEKNLTHNVYDLTDPTNVWNFYVEYGLKGPIKIRKNVLGTTKYTLEDPLVILKRILERHSKIPTLENGYIDWNMVFELLDDDFRYIESKLNPSPMKSLLL